MKSPVVDELASDKENIKKGEEANKKPLIEILEIYQNKPENTKTEEEREPVKPKTFGITNKQSEEMMQKSKNNDYQQPEGIITEGHLIIDHDKKLLKDLLEENSRGSTSQLNNKSNENKTGNLEKPMKKQNILEIKATDSKSIKTKSVCIKEILKTIPKDSKDEEQINKNITVTEIPKSKDDSEKKVKAEKGGNKGKETKKEEKDSSKGNDTASVSVSHRTGDSQQPSER